MTERDRIENVAKLHNYIFDQEEPGEFFIYNQLHEFHVVEKSPEAFNIHPDFDDINLPKGLKILKVRLVCTDFSTCVLYLIAREGEKEEASLSADEIIKIIRLN